METEHPVRRLRREAIDAAQSMEYATTLRAKAECRGEMYGLCKALSIIITADAPAGYATAGYAPVGRNGERVLRNFLGASKAAELLGPEN